MMRTKYGDNNEKNKNYYNGSGRRKDKKMKILFVGDIMLGRTVNAILKHNPVSYPWGNTLTILNNADLRICNLECVMTDMGQPWPGKTFTFRTDPKNVEVFNITRFSPISIANNHALDFGASALTEMINILSTNSINFAGAGDNIAEASMPALENGKKNYVGMVAFTDNEPNWEATEKSPGIFYVPVDLNSQRTRLLFDTIKRTRDDVKILIVSAHWGPNWGYDVPWKHITFAHALIDAGADIIFGHSPHVFRGIEIYKNKPILYSCGNFIDDYAVDEIERNDQSFIFVVETNKSKINKLLLFPTVIRNFQARFAEGLEMKEIASKMQELCLQLKTKSLWQEKERRLRIEI